MEETNDTPVIPSATDETKGETDNKEKTEIKTLQQIAVEQNAKLPKSLTPDQLNMQLLLDHHMGSQIAVQAFKKLSQRGKDRLWAAIMQLPHAGLDISLNGKLEKEIYLAAQKVQMCKHAIVFSRAKKEHDAEQKALAEKAKKKQDEETVKTEIQTKGEDNVGSESTSGTNEETSVAQSGVNVSS